MERSVANICGIDLSLRETGLCVISPDMGVLTTAFLPVKLKHHKGKLKTLCDWEDARELSRRLTRALSSLSFLPGCLVVEMAGGSQSNRGAKCGGLAVGALAGTFPDLPIVVVTPQACKKAMTGKGGGSKAEVAEGVREVAGWRSDAKTKKEREAVTDAVAAVLTAWDNVVVQMARKA